VFRRGSRREAPPEKSSPGIVDQQPFWLAGEEAKPARGRAGSGVALLGDAPRRPAEQQRSNGVGPSHGGAPSPLRGVTIPELVEALSRPFSPPQLDWDLVGVAFVEVPMAAEPEVEVWLIEERADGMLVEEQIGVVVMDEADAQVVAGEQAIEPADVPDREVDEDVLVVEASSQPADELVEAVVVEEPAPAPAPEPVRSEPPPPLVSPRALAMEAAGNRKRKALREHDQVMAAVRELSWEGYCSLLADIFRHEGYEVFAGEGDDGDVIDMEVLQGGERMLVNCQLRGIRDIDVAPLAEMLQVAARNSAHGAFIVTDGDFTAEAWSFAATQALVLIDCESLLGLVLDFTLGSERDKKLSARLARLLRGPEAVGRPQAS
jgi:hypothetical protein